MYGYFSLPFKNKEKCKLYQIFLHLCVERVTRGENTCSAWDTNGDSRMACAHKKRIGDNLHHQFVVGYDSENCETRDKRCRRLLAFNSRRPSCLPIGRELVTYFFCIAMRCALSHHRNVHRSISSRNTPAVLRVKIFPCEISLLLRNPCLYTYNQ